MPKSATGANSPRGQRAGPAASDSSACTAFRAGFGARARGFTLVEILVVVVIAGVLTGTVLLGLARSGPGQVNQREIDRLAASLQVMCDQALLSGSARGLRFHADGYDFWVHGVNGWQRLSPDAAPDAVQWPEGVRARVEVENTAIRAGRNARLPQVVCTGIEPPTPFEVELGRGEQQRRLAWPS